MTSQRNGRIFLLLCFTSIALLQHPVAVIANRPPMFIRDMNSQAINEDSPIGASVYRLEGTDPDGDGILYGLRGTDHLAVDNVTGIVTIAKQLDHKTTPAMKFNVTLDDRNAENQTVSVPVSVTVLQTDEKSHPAFQEEMYDVKVPEDAVVGATILDDVTLVGRNLTVECHPLAIALLTETCNLITLRTNEVDSGNYSVSLILQQLLDYDVARFHQVVLSASNGKTNVSATVTIRIEDVQNKPPVFISQRFLSISESTQTGTTVMMIKAKDGDATNSRNVTYDLLSNPGGFLGINYLTGELVVAKKIDRESMKSGGLITLRVRARENEGGLPLDGELVSTTAEFRIAIIDVNDEPPRFNRNDTQVTLAEGQPNGTALPNLNLFVFDPDINSRATLTLTLTDSTSTGHFRLETPRINGSGAVLISTRSEPLDYENSAHRKFVLLVTAKEEDTAEKFSSTATVTVNVIDVNDNAPQFASDKYEATVSESAEAGSTVAKITADDGDRNVEYGAESIRYSLLGEGAQNFEVDRVTGVVSVGGHNSTNLDFESQSSYYLTYQARDANGSGFLSVVSLKIDLLDADDNPPTFLQDQYRGVINEGDVEFTPNFIVEAQDKDKSSRLRYEIVNGNLNNTFTIDSSTGELRASGSSGVHSDSIGSNKFNLTIRVIDSGQNSAVTNAIISVQDMNNNAPVFDQKEYQGNVSETAPQGFVAGQVVATDSDSDNNGLVEYRISRGARDCFIINETTGVVTVAANGTLDYDVRPEYSIEILAVDRGTPPRTAMTIMTVSIQDSNNKPPQFTPKIQQAQVSEDAKVGHIIYTLNASDPDATTPDALKYRILDEFDNNTFGVDEASGDIQVMRKIRRENQAEVTMTVTVIDSSANPPQTGTGTVIITVININDAAPIFPAPWSPSNPAIFINVLEEQPVGSIVYTFVAIDADSNIAGYAIIPDDPYFDIDIISGIVTIKSRIDYETIQKHEFKVLAFDTGVPQLSASAIVTATINNINDNDPLFNQSEYRAEILENSPIGTSVTTVFARDQDLGDFGRIAYSLIGSQSDVFTVDNQGVISVKNGTRLDREINPVFTVHVVAMDTAPAEMARRSLPTPVIISLLDVNDNIPKFSQKEYRASVMDSILVFPPTPILQLSARDDDDGLNAHVIYKITAGNADGTFILNSRTGVLFPAVSLSGNSKRHSLKVEARDGNGTSDNYDETNVIVEVQEVNANAPKMIAPTSKNSTIHITENEFQGDKMLWTLQAEDPDSGENGRIHYFIKDGDRDLVETSFFSIDPDKGHIRLNGPLDREMTARHTLVVVARDDGVPQPFETLQQLCVVVKDVNDNAPEFLRTMFTNPYAFRVNENLPVGSFVGQVDAVDRDARDNAAIYYFLQEVGDEGIFAVDRLTGSIYTNKSLDFETRQQYELILVATNNASYYGGGTRHRNRVEPLPYDENDRTTAHVKVYVGDINDNVPTFPESTYVAGISSNAKIGETVTRVTALDPDREDRDSLIYTIEKTTLFSLGTRDTARSMDSPPFVIGRHGHVTTTGAMSVYSQDHFKMAIKCRESSAAGRSTTTTLDAWIYEDEQLVTVVLTRTTADVRRLLPIITKNLSNVTAGIAIVTDIIEHPPTDTSKHNSLWSRLVILVIDSDKRVVKRVPDVLESISRNANYLNVRPEVYSIVQVLPLKSEDKLGEFDIVMTTLIALCIVLLIGIILLVIVVNCLKRWYKDKMIAIVTKREIPDPETTTENPLWIDTDSPVWVDPVTKPYEEQELSMAVLNDQEMQNRRKMVDQNGQSPQAEAMYATIRRNGRSVRDNLSTMEANDGYAAVSQDHPNRQHQHNHHRSDYELRTSDHNGTLRSMISGYHETNPNGTLSRSRPYTSQPNPTASSHQKPVVTVKPHQGIIHAHEGEPFAISAVL